MFDSVSPEGVLRILYCLELDVKKSKTDYPSVTTGVCMCVFRVMDAIQLQLVRGNPGVQMRSCVGKLQLNDD